jgi:hypothetical protein
MYPQLTGGAKSFSERLRQRGIYALIGIVSMCVIAGIFFGDALFSKVWARPSHIIAEAKPSETVVVETVVVSNFAPHIEPARAAISGCVETLAFNSGRPLSHLNSGRDDIFPLKAILLNREILQPTFIGKHTVNKPSNISRREVANVLESNVAGKERLPAGETSDAKRIYAQVSALKDSSIFDLNKYTDTGGYPKTDGRNGQHSGEQREPPSIVRKPFFGSIFGGYVIGAVAGLTLLNGLWRVIRR